MPVMKQRQALTVRCGLLCLMVACLNASASEISTWSQVAEEIAARITLAESLYQNDKQNEAGQAVTQAYFGVFEDRKMEAAMRMELGAKHTYQVEKQFGALRKAIRQQADRQTVQTLAQGIREAVVRDARVLDQANIPMQVFEIKP
jgi:nicotinamide mononucleotide (NMN) deamidase PncC